MSDAEWDALTARLRSPDAAESLRDAASQHISGERLDAFCALAHPSAYVDEAGTVNHDKLAGHLRALFNGVPPAAPAPGEGGRAAAEKRFKVIEDGRRNGYISNDRETRDAAQ